jgi:DNA-binding NarL/FixJ family response regulator
MRNVKKSGRIVNEISKKLRSLELSMRSEPVVVLSGEGSAWFSEPARKLIAEKKVDRGVLLSRLRWQRQHLCSTSCCGMDIISMRLDGDDLLFILREHESDDDMFNLTAKEKEILEHLVTGKTNKEIASLLNGISPGTVNTHLDSIYRKLGVSNRAEATYVALKNGIVIPRESEVRTREKE